MANEQPAKPANEGLIAKLNKSGTDPVEEFKLGVGLIDKPVGFVDNGIRTIQKKLRRGSSESES